MRWLARITDSMNMGLSKLWDILKGREAWYTEGQGSSSWGCKELDTTEQLNNKKENHTLLGEFTHCTKQTMQLVQKVNTWKAVCMIETSPPCVCSS